MIKTIITTITITLALSLTAVVYAAGDAVQALTPEYFDPPTDAEVMDEYIRLLKERNDAMEDYLEILELRNLHLEGKLHSS